MIRLRGITTGHRLDRKKVLIGRSGNTEVNINVDNGDCIVSGLNRNGLGYDYHRSVLVKEMRVTITGGDLCDGEYMVRKMTPSQIYETLRDGFTVTTNAF